MADEGGRQYSEKKLKYAERLENLIKTLPKVLLICADNVGSQQMHVVRAELRKDGQKAEILMGKNTMIKFIIRRAAAENPALNKLVDAIKLNVGLVFTDCEPKKIREILEKNKVVAGAKAGAIAPTDVFLEAGPTGMEPAQTNFFQALGIATKITKGTIEVIKQVALARANERVGPSEAALMTKMGMKPFLYGLKVTHVFDGEGMVDPAVLDIEDDDIKECFKNAMGRVAAVGLKIGYPVAPAVPHMFVNAFRNLVALTLETEVSFKEVTCLFCVRVLVLLPVGGGGGGAGRASKVWVPTSFPHLASSASVGRSWCAEVLPSHVFISTTGLASRWSACTCWLHACGPLARARSLSVSSSLFISLSLSGSRASVCELSNSVCSFMCVRVRGLDFMYLVHTCTRSTDISLVHTLSLENVHVCLALRARGRGRGNSPQRRFTHAYLYTAQASLYVFYTSGFYVSCLTEGLAIHTH